MKKITRTLVSLALIISYGVSFTPACLAEWALQEKFTAPGAFDGTKMVITPNAQSTVWQMKNMDLDAGQVGTINTYGGPGMTNVYAEINGNAMTRWDGTLNAPGVNFAAYNPAGFLIGSSGVVNASALLLTTGQLNVDQFKNGKYQIDGNQDAAITLNNGATINAGAVMMAAKSVSIGNKEVTSSSGESFAKINAHTVKIGAGDIVKVQVDNNMYFEFSDFNDSMTIAEALAGANVSMIATNNPGSDSGLVANYGQIFSGTDAITEIGESPKDFKSKQVMFLDNDSNGIEIATAGGVQTYWGAMPETESEIYEGLYVSKLAQIATHGVKNDSNIKITAAEGVIHNSIISTQGEVEYHRNDEGGIFSAVNTDSKGTVTLAATGGTESELKINECGRIYTKDITFNSAGDVEFNGGGQIKSLSNDKQVDMHVTAGQDIINNGEFDFSGTMNWDAGRDIVNNGEVSTPSTSTNPVTWVAGRYIVQNGTVDFKNGTSSDNIPAVSWNAGRSIITTDDQSAKALKDADVAVQYIEASKYRDTDGNAETTMNPSKGAISLIAGEDIINNGITNIATNNSSEIKIEAGRNIIQNNKFDAKAGGDMHIAAGTNSARIKDGKGGYIITTDNESRIAVKEAGLNSWNPLDGIDDIKFVSSEVKGITDGYARTNLQADGDKISAKAELDFINNGITTVKAKNANLEAGRNFVQNNVLTFVDTPTATLKAPTLYLMNNDMRDNSNITFVSKAIEGDSVTNIIANESTPVTLKLDGLSKDELVAKINVDAKNATIETNSDDLTINGGTVNGLDEFKADLSGIFESTGTDRHPKSTAGTLYIGKADKSLIIDGGTVNAYNLTANAKDIEIRNKSTVTAGKTASLTAKTGDMTIKDSKVQSNTGDVILTASNGSIDIQGNGAGDYAVKAGNDVTLNSKTMSLSDANLNAKNNIALTTTDAGSEYSMKLDKATVESTDGNVTLKADSGLLKILNGSKLLASKGTLTTNSNTLDMKNSTADAKVTKLSTKETLNLGDDNNTLKGTDELTLHSGKNINITGTNVALNSDGNITLDAVNDVVVAEGAKVLFKNITDNKTITGNVIAGNEISNNGTLDFKGSGKLESKYITMNDGIVTATGNAELKATGTGTNYAIELDNATIESTGGDVTLKADSGLLKILNGSKLLASNGKVTTSSGTLNLDDSSVNAKDASLTTTAGDMTITDSKIVATNATSAENGNLYLNSQGKMAISDSTVEATSGNVNLVAANGVIDIQGNGEDGYSVKAGNDVTLNSKTMSLSNTNLNAKNKIALTTTDAGSDYSMKLDKTTVESIGGNVTLKADSGVLNILGNSKVLASAGTVTTSSKALNLKNSEVTGKGISATATDNIMIDNATISSTGSADSDSVYVVSSNGSLQVLGNTNITSKNDLNLAAKQDVTLGSADTTTALTGDVVNIIAGNNIDSKGTVNITSKSVDSEDYTLLNAGNQWKHSGKMMFDGKSANVYADSIAMNGGTVNSNGVLGLYTTGNQTYENSTLSAAGMEMGAVSDGVASGNISIKNSTVNTTVEDIFAYGKGVDIQNSTYTGATDTYAVATDNLNISNSKINAGSGIVGLQAGKDVTISGSTVASGDYTLIMAGNNFSIDNSQLTANTDFEAYAGKDINLSGANTKLTAGKDLVMKADSGHYTANPTGGVINNNTGKQLNEVISTPKGKWNIYSNATDALAKDSTLYVYDQENPAFTYNGDRIVFYGKGADEPQPGPGPGPGPGPEPEQPLDPNLVQSLSDQPQELTVWKRYVNHVDETKSGVNSAVDNYVKGEVEYNGTPIIKGLNEIEPSADETLGYSE